jgi:DNA-binding MarR family transcriptional regulator
MSDRPPQTTVRSPAAPDLDPILDFMRLLWSVEHGLQSTSKRMEASLGITGPQRLVLRIVSQRPGLSPGEVARIVHLHPSTITGILQRLLKKGLIRREPDSKDHRRIRLHSQAAAREFVAASTGTVESAVTRALTRMPRHRVRHAREVLSAIANALDDDTGPGARIDHGTGRRRR